MMDVHFTSDFHSAFSKGMRAIEFLAEVKNEGAVIVDSGDFVAESGFGSFSGHEASLALMRALFDAVCPGNHGFTETHALPNATCCNLYKGGRRVCAPKIEVTRNGTTVAFVGVLGEEAFAAVPYSERTEMELIPPFEALSDLFGRGVIAQRVILLSHCGFTFDETIASKFPQLTAIISGHCHSSRYVARVGGVSVIKAPEVGEGTGYLNISRSGEISRLTIQTSFADSQALATSQLIRIRQDLIEFQNWAERNLGEHRADLFRVREERGVYFDLLLNCISKHYDGIPFLTNLFVFRDIPKGLNITEGDLMEFIPFENRIILIQDELLAEFEAKIGTENNIKSSHEAPYTALLTTDYLLESVLQRPYVGSRLHKLRDVVRNILVD